MLKRTTIACAFVVLATGTVLADSDKEAKEKAEKNVENLKKTVERDMKEKEGEAPITCETLLTEGRNICAIQIKTGAKLNCMLSAMGYRSATKPPKSKKLSPEQKAKVQAGTCRVHVRRMRRELEKAQEAGLPPESGPKCAELGEVFGVGCFPESGEPARHCNSVPMMLRNVTGDKREKSCEGLLALFKKS